MHEMKMLKRGQSMTSCAQGETHTVYFLELLYKIPLAVKAAVVDETGR